jgi:hypothetical protein
MKPNTLEEAFDDVENYLFGRFARESLNELKKLVYARRHIDPVLGCVITEPPPAKGGQGEHYHPTTATFTSD